MIVDPTGCDADLKPRKYVLPFTGLSRSRKLFSFDLLPGEERLFEHPIFFNAGSFPVHGFLWTTNLRIVVLQYRWIKSPVVFEIPRKCISSIDCQSTDPSAWIDVNYQSPDGQERIQLRTGNRYTRRKQVISANHAILSELRQIVRKHPNQHVLNSEDIRETPWRVFLLMKVILIAGLIGCLRLLPYMAMWYSQARKSLQLYNSSAECSLAQAESKIFSGSRCEIRQEQIAQMYTRHPSRTWSYYLVLEGGQNSRELVQLGKPRQFYSFAHVGDQVQVQRFNGEIVALVDGHLSVTTINHPQWRTDNYKTGLWMLGVLSLTGLIFMRKMLRFFTL